MKNHYFGNAIVRIFFVFLFLTMISCNEDKIENPANTVNPINSSYARTFTGDSLILQNPYRLATMQNALDTVKANNPSSSFAELNNFNIAPSHLYMKFNPRDVQEEALLKSDSTLIFSDYRLDCEYAEGFLEKREINNKDSITDYYIAYPINKTIPNVRYEVIDELYIPEQDRYFDDARDESKYVVTKHVGNKTDLLNNLLFEAFKATGNQEELIDDYSTDGDPIMFARRWRGWGIINIWNTAPGETSNNTFVPVEGAKVLMRQWFTVDQGITDAQGFFTTGLIRGKARYILQWERYNYSIRSGAFGQAETAGPELKEQSWIKSIAGGHEQYYGTIHRAAHHYYYKYIQNLRRPPMYGNGLPQMKIGAFPEAGSVLGNFRCLETYQGLWPTIKIYNWARSSIEIYATTIHELGHASHYKMDKINFLLSNRRVTESWARGIQGELTTMVYPNYRAVSLPDYTLVVRDMLDNDNVFGASGIVGENVTGYTIRQLEDALNGEHDWDGWKNNIKNNYINATENNLDLLFNYWH